MYWKVSQIFIGCENSDGLRGFQYSHDGWWENFGDVLPSFTNTIMECANTCLQDCAAIVWGKTKHINWPGQCYHYSRVDIVSANEKFSQEGLKAYVKCPGNNV